MTMDAPDASDDTHPARLTALLSVLQAHGFVADLEDSGLRLQVSSPRDPDLKVRLRCAPREADGGRLWFLGDQRRPVAAADDITGALVAIKGLTAQ
jgi:hypothetical protein